MIGSLLATLIVASAAAPAPEDVGLTPRLGEHVASDVHLLDHRGNPLMLDDWLDGEHPVVLVLAYYRCPMLCDLVLRGTAENLGRIEWEPGQQYRAITVSFDPRDRPPAAERARASTTDAFGRDLEEDAWPFTVTSEEDARRLADSLGFGYAYDERTDQYAHPAVVFVLAPDGTLSRTLPGPAPEPLDLRLALVEAGRGEIGSIAEQVLLTCYRYDPTSRRYGPWIFGFLRLGGVLMLLTAGVVGFGLWRLERRRRRREREEGLP